jgi:lysine N6-hydroxylase
LQAITKANSNEGVRMKEPIYDFIAVGLGPFNLGLACLSQPLDELNGLFIDMADGFNWHPGMLLDQATMQTSFIADLVTLADPTSPYSFLNYLKQSGRMYAFYIKEDFFLLRQEYNQYCQWAAAQLSPIRFNQLLKLVSYNEAAQYYELLCVSTQNGEQIRYRTRKLVLGTGTKPCLPPCCEPVRSHLIHSSEYLKNKAQLQRKKSITLTGSGQSAAEIYLDLLKDSRKLGYRVDWLTRSSRFFPLEYTKLTLEMTSPDYVDYFHALPETTRDQLLQEQKGLYKGINRSTINAIYDELYAQSLHGTPQSRLLTNTELLGCQYQDGEFILDLQHAEQDQVATQQSDALIVATGYCYQEPAFLQGIAHRIKRDKRGRFDVARNYSIDIKGGDIFVQNAELHTHGLAAPDLTMACHRNSIILREILGRDIYPIEDRIAFQTFGLPSSMQQQAQHAWA